MGKKVDFKEVFSREEYSYLVGSVCTYGALKTLVEARLGYEIVKRIGGGEVRAGLVGKEHFGVGLEVGEGKQNLVTEWFYVPRTIMDVNGSVEELALEQETLSVFDMHCLRKIVLGPNEENRREQRSAEIDVLIPNCPAENRRLLVEGPGTLGRLFERGYSAPTSGFLAQAHRYDGMIKVERLVGDASYQAKAQKYAKRLVETMRFRCGEGSLYPRIKDEIAKVLYLSENPRTRGELSAFTDRTLAEQEEFMIALDLLCRHYEEEMVIVD